MELVQAFEKEKYTTEDPTKISPLLREEVPQAIYSFDCLSTEFLQQFNEELQHFYEMSKKYKIPVRRPNSSKYICDETRRDY